MKSQAKLKLRSEKGSVQGEHTPGLHDSSFSIDERASLDRSMSVQGLPMEQQSGVQSQHFLQPFFLPNHMNFPYQQAILPPNLHFNMRGFPAQPQLIPFNLFKTNECGIKTYHEHKQCPYFHSLKDRRRCPKKYRYEPEMCPSVKLERPCLKQDQCTFCHNTVEDFYHPRKFRTKLCSSAGREDGAKCAYGQYCSFAHTEDELKIPLLHRMDKTPDFFKYLYKTIYCPFNHQHEKSNCPYAHNVQDFRRNPRTVAYSADLCKKWLMSAEIAKYSDGGCNFNEACSKCHGWKELEYHPKYYKSKACGNADRCQRQDCGYLHPNETSKKTTDHSKLHESFKESMTSSSLKLKNVAASQSHQSSSKEEQLLTFKSSSQSRIAKNDSVLGRPDEDDQHDLRSIADFETSSRQHARTEKADDDESADGSVS